MHDDQNFHSLAQAFVSAVPRTFKEALLSQRARIASPKKREPRRQDRRIVRGRESFEGGGNCRSHEGYLQKKFSKIKREEFLLDTVGRTAYLVA